MMFGVVVYYILVSVVLGTYFYVSDEHGKVEFKKKPIKQCAITIWISAFLTFMIYMAIQLLGAIVTHGHSLSGKSKDPFAPLFVVTLVMFFGGVAAYGILIFIKETFLDRIKK